MTSNQRRRGLVLVVSSVLLLHHTSATAQSAHDAAAAESLFSEAKREMDAGRYEAACPLLAESQRLDPGGGTLLNLAVCHEKIGKTASAWAEFEEAVVIARRDGRADRVELAQEHLRSLSDRLVRMSVVVPDAHRVQGLDVRVDGAPRTAITWGRALPIDPGTHVISAAAPGRKSWTTEIVIEPRPPPGVPLQVEVPALEPEGTVVAQPATTPVEPRSAPSHGSGRTVGTIVVGGGVVAMGLGTFFGLRAAYQHSESNAACESGCTKRGVELEDEAITSADVSTGSFIVGAVALGAGVFLFITSRPKLARAQATWPLRW